MAWVARIESRDSLAYTIIHAYLFKFNKTETEENQKFKR